MASQTPCFGEEPGEVLKHLYARQEGSTAWQRLQGPELRGLDLFQAPT